MTKNMIIKLFKVWHSSQNGYVYSLNGVSPTISYGCHAGVEPKIMIVYD